MRINSCAGVIIMDVDALFARIFNNSAEKYAVGLFLVNEGKTPLRRLNGEANV